MPPFTFVSLSLLTLFFQEGQANSITPSEIQKTLLNPKLWNAAPIVDWDKFLGKTERTAEQGLMVLCQIHSISSISLLSISNMALNYSLS